MINFLKKTSHKAQKICTGIGLLLIAFASSFTHANTEFTNMINQLDDMPDKVSNIELEFKLIKKNNRLPKHLFYGAKGRLVLGIGKVETANTYVVLVGDVVSKATSDFDMIFVHGYNFTKEGKLISREPFICGAGVMESTRVIHSCKINFEDNPVFSFWKTSIRGYKTYRELDTYIINPNGKLKQSSTSKLP